MNKIFKVAVLPLLAVLAAISCSRKDDYRPAAGGEGFLELNLSYDFGVTAVKAVDEDPVFRIVVTDLKTGVVVKTVEDHHTLAGNPLSLTEGSYSVEAMNGEDVEAAFDAPYYKGADTVDVVAGETAYCDIVCTMANVKVTVSMSENIPLNFQSYQVTVSNGMEGASLIYGGETLASEGYFRCTEKLEWTIDLVNNDGESFSQSGEITGVQPRDYYNLNFDIKGSTTVGGGLTLTVTVDGTLNDKEHIIDITDMPVVQTEVSTGSVNPWAKFAYVTGEYTVAEAPEGLGFQYKKAADAGWTDFSGEVSMDGTSFSARITGLEPDTEYEVRAVSAADKRDANAVSFTTEAAEQLPNFNFDLWSDNGHSPNAEGTAFWDSGNKGASLMNKYPTSQETSFVVSGSAVKMASQFVGLFGIGQFAGGNIYSGAYVETVGMSGAKIDFGQPYTCRPTALHGWYSYTPVAIDYTKDPYTDLAGTMDVGRIFVALTDWTEPFHVNNTDGTLFTSDDPGVIAYGELNIEEATGNEYREFTINLEYRDLERIPTHVLVVAAASKYADYFTGGNGTVMYIDEFEFTFE